MTEELRAVLDHQGSFTTDWFGAPLPGPISYRLTLQPDELIFSATFNVAPSYNPAHKAGEFVEGIWLHDAAELFIAEAITQDDSGGESGWKNARYQEFNFSPLGAWWSCVFDSYRVPAAQQPAPLAAAAAQKPTIVPTIQTTLSPNSWSMTASIPRSLILVNSLNQPLSPAHPSSLNIAFIINETTFASLNARADLTPDFHRVDTYPKIAKLPSQALTP